LGSGFDVDALAQFMFPGLPPEWLRVPQVFWYVILPFITVFTVVYGLMKELRIFRHVTNKIYVVLAFCFSMLLLPSGVLTYIVVNLYAFGAAFAAITFGVVFMLGVVLWGLATSWRWWGDVTYERALTNNINYMYKNLREMERQKMYLIHQLRSTDEKGRSEVERQLQEIETRIIESEGRLHKLKRYD